MNNENYLHHLKETRQENLLTLKRAIDNNSLDEIVDYNREWGGAYVIITSSQDNIFNPETDEDDWFSHKSQSTYVLTKNSIPLSKFFVYIRDKIMERRDNYLYGFMGLLAKDFIKQFGDADDYNLLLDYVFSGVSFYLGYFDWKCGMGKSNNAFKMMRFFLSEQISDEEIRHIF